MIALTVTATLRAPVHLGAKNTGAYFMNSLRFIPGRSLLGAAAWACLDRGDDPAEPTFQRRFISGDVSWGDLLPVPLESHGGGPLDAMPMLAPRTAKTCKLFGLDHGCADTLLSVGGHGGECTRDVGSGQCGAGLKRMDGVVAVSGANELRAVRRPALGYRTHLAVGFETGSARHGYLYSREVLQEGQVFRGQIKCCNADAADELRADLQELPLAVGQGRSRGYGLLEIDVQLDPAAPLTVDEITRCSDSLAERYEGARYGDQARSGARYFTLTAASAWCVRTPDGGYHRALSSARLAQLLDVDPSTIDVVAGDMRAETRSGWDGAAGLPIEVRHFIVAGSTLLCRTTGLADQDLVTRLGEILSRGIGDHRLEGLGRVVVNHPLHVAHREDYSDH
ncbi:MAG: hypothetical protein MJE77_44015 [Proteobacteria bacterium]|nr:hypothetical protein [Pseudomonadota bacterium]